MIPSQDKRKKYVLTDQGQQIILTCYNGTPRKTVWIAQQLGVPCWRVRLWARQLGLEKPRAELHWTEEEENYLRENLHKESLTTLAEKLRRSEIAIQSKAKRLGINKVFQRGYTMRGLCEGLGCDHKTVTRWINLGWLKGARRQTKHKEHDTWYFSDRAIRSFIKHHPEEVDPRRAYWPWLVDILVSEGLGNLSE